MKTTNRTTKGSEGIARSVLECGSPLPLSDASRPSKSARGLAQSKTWRLIIALLLLSTLDLQLPTLLAATRTWDGSANGYLSTPANWVGGVAPANGDDLVFPASGVTRFLVTNNIIGGPNFPTITFNGNGFTLSGAFIVTTRVGAENVAGVNRVTCALQLGGPATFYINGAAGALFDIDGNITLGANTLSVSAGGGSLFLGGVISGTGGINKISGGVVRFDGNADNTYTGLTTIFGGTLELFKGPANTLAVPGDLNISGAADIVRLLRDNQLAATTDVTLGAGALLDLNGFSTPIATLRMTGGSVTGGTLNLNGDVTTTSVAASTPLITSTLNLGAATRTFTVHGSQPFSDLQISGAITGAGGVTKAGPGVLSIFGITSNTYGGPTRVNEGTLRLRRTALDRSIPGDLFIGDGVGGPLSDVVRLEIAPQIDNLSAVTIASSGYLDVNDNIVEEIGSLAGEGRVNVGPAPPEPIGRLNVGLNGASTTYSGVITGPGEFGKAGAGTLNLTGNNTLTGATLAGQGTLLVNGAQPQSPLNVTPGGTLSGTGIVGHVTVLGDLRPGSSPGLLTCSNLFFAALGDFFVEVNGGVPGAEHDQMNVRGSVTLNNSTLHVPLSLPTPVGQSFVIINNDGNEAVSGTFAGLAEGAVFTGPAGNFRITYQGGDGNDVVLTRVGALATAFGLQHMGLEQATFSTGPSGELVVGNLAPSGNDGVHIPIGDAQGWLGRFAALEPATGQGRLGWEIQGQLGNLPLRPLMRGHLEVSNGQVYAFADSRAVGANAHWVEAFAGDEFVAAVLAASNWPVLVGTNHLTPTLRCEGPLPGKPYWSWELSWPEPRRISLPGTNVTMLDGVTRVRMRPWVLPGARAPVVGPPSAVQLTGRDISEIRIADEALLHPPFPADDGLPHRALGQARFGPVPNDGVPIPEDGRFIVSNIGASGQDGVSIDAEGRSSGIGILTAPISLTPAGTVIALSAVGTFDNQPNRSMGTASLRRVGGTFQAMADFTPVGSAMVRVEVFRGSNLVGSAVVPPGVVATASGAADLPSIDAVGWIPPCYLPAIDGIAQPDFEPLSCYLFHFDKETVFLVPGDTALVGDSLRLLQANDQPRAQSLARLEIRAALGGVINPCYAVLGEKLRLPAPQITRIFPTQTRAGEIVEIRGRGFGKDASDLGVIGLPEATGIEPTPFHILSASDTRILARVGQVRPGTPNSPVHVFRGVGHQATPQVAAANVEFLQPLRAWRETTPSGSWEDDSVSPPIKAVHVYTPAKIAPTRERCFFSEPPVENELCLYITTWPWNDNVEASFDANLTPANTQDTLSLAASGVRLLGHTDLMGGAQRLAEVLEAAFAQLLFLTVNIDVTPGPGGSAKLTLTTPNTLITSGFLNICIRPSQFEFAVTDVQPRIFTEGDLVSIKGRGFGDDARDLRVGLRDAEARLVPLQVLRATDTQLLARMGPAPPDFTQGPLEVMRGRGYQAQAATVWEGFTTSPTTLAVAVEPAAISRCYYSWRNSAAFPPWEELDDYLEPHLVLEPYWPYAVAITIRALVHSFPPASTAFEKTFYLPANSHWQDNSRRISDEFEAMVGAAGFVLQMLRDGDLVNDPDPPNPQSVRFVAYMTPHYWGGPPAVMGSFSICVRASPTEIQVGQAAAAGGFVRISGSGFGGRAEDLSVALLEGGGPRLIPLEVLAASDTEITARFGAVPSDARPGPLVVSRGRGSLDPLEPFFDETTLDAAVAYAGDGGIRSVVSPGNLSPEAGNPAFFSLPSDGPLGIELPTDWFRRASLSIAAAIHDTNGATYELRVPAARFAQAGNPVDCAERVADVIRSAFWQQAALAVDVGVTQPARGGVWLTMSLPDGAIARGYIALCFGNCHATALHVRVSGGGAEISWTGAGALQEANDPAGPWRDVLPAPTGSPHLQPAGGSAKFFRLRE